MQFRMPMYMPGPLEEQKFREQMGWGQAQPSASPEDQGGMGASPYKNPFQATMPTPSLTPQQPAFAPPPPKPGHGSVFAELLDPRRQQLAQMTKGRG